MNGWIAVDDELCSGDPSLLRRLAQELSYRTGGVVLTLGVEEEAVVRYVLFDRGSVADEYSLAARVPRATAARRRRRSEREPDRRAPAHRSRPAARARRREDRPPPQLTCPPPKSSTRSSRLSRGAAPVITLYDADRCPYCARVRIVLAEKSVPYDTVVIDLSDRPAWLYEKNPLGKVPVLEEDGLCIPESTVIMELLEERFPEPPLYPADPAQRALARLAVWRFDDEFSRDYYAARRGDDGCLPRALHVSACRLDRRLTEFPFLAGHEYSLADIAWFPWLPRAEAYFGLRLEDYPAIAAWRDRLAERPAIAAEIDVVASLAV